MSWDSEGKAYILCLAPKLNDKEIFWTCMSPRLGKEFGRDKVFGELTCVLTQVCVDTCNCKETQPQWAPSGLVL